MAKILYRKGYCSDCDKNVRVTANGINHILHLILAVGTAGCWLFIWFLLAIETKPWRCCECGSKVLGSCH